MSNSVSPPAEPGVYPEEITWNGLHGAWNDEGAHPETVNCYVCEKEGATGGAMDVPAGQADAGMPLREDIARAKELITRSFGTTYR